MKWVNQDILQSVIQFTTFVINTKVRLTGVSDFARHTHRCLWCLRDLEILLTGVSDGRRDEKENHPRLAKSGHHFPEVAGDEEDFYFFFTGKLGKGYTITSVNQFKNRAKPFWPIFIIFICEMIFYGLSVFLFVKLGEFS